MHFLWIPWEIHLRYDRTYICVYQGTGVSDKDLIYLSFRIVGRKKGGNKNSGNCAVEQQTLVRHRLTFHRNPLASSAKQRAGGRVSWPRLRCLIGSTACDLATEHDMATSYSREPNDQEHSPFRRERYACAWLYTLDVRRIGTPTRGIVLTARRRPFFASSLSLFEYLKASPYSNACATNSATCGALPPPKCRRPSSNSAARNANAVTIPERNVFSMRVFGRLLIISSSLSVFLLLFFRYVFPSIILFSLYSLVLFFVCLISQT